MLSIKKKRMKHEGKKTRGLQFRGGSDTRHYASKPYGYKNKRCYGYSKFGPNDKKCNDPKNPNSVYFIKRLMFYHVLILNGSNREFL